MAVPSVNTSTVSSRLRPPGDGSTTLSVTDSRDIWQKAYDNLCEKDERFRTALDVLLFENAPAPGQGLDFCLN